MAGQVTSTPPASDPVAALRTANNESYQQNIALQAETKRGNSQSLVQQAQTEGNARDYKAQSTSISSQGTTEREILAEQKRAKDSAARITS
jgi:hypothetical protein